MTATNYFLAKAADYTDIHAWSSIVPARSHIFRTNLFGDHFLVDDLGTVHMLDRGGCAIQRIAASEEEFGGAVEDDSQGWQLRSLVDACRNEGKPLMDAQCYAFTTPPVLGGEYAVENVWAASLREWFSFTDDLFRQIEGMPDGATVSLKVVD